MSRTARGYALALKALVSKPCTAHDLVRVSSLHLDTILKFIHVMRKAPRQLRICEYRYGRNGAPTIKVYELNPGPDAAKPRPKTAAERQSALKERQRANSLAALTTAWNRQTNELGIRDCEDEDCRDQAGAPEAAVLRPSDV